MRYEFDEEKIKREGLYDLEDMKRIIDDAAKHFHLRKTSEGTYMARGDKDDLVNVGDFIYQCLIDCEWFTKNVKTWEWLKDSTPTTDIIKRNKERGKGVWA